MTNKLTHHLLLVSDSCEKYYKELMENYIKNDERLSEKKRIKSIGMDKINEHL